MSGDQPGSDGRPSTGDPELDSLLLGIERSAEIDAETNYRVIDNHLRASDRVIANLAALKNLTDNTLLEAFSSDPTQ